MFLLPASVDSKVNQGSCPLLPLSISEVICGFHVPAEALRCTVYRAPQIPSGSNASEGPGGRRGWSSSRSWLAEEALLGTSSEASDLKLVNKDGLC